MPPTVYRRSAPYGPGSVQLFIDHDANYQYFTFSQEDRQRLRPVALFDLIVNNADRKGGHILFDAEDHLWLIDHGLCFHVEDKLRTASGILCQPIPPNRSRRSKNARVGKISSALTLLSRLLAPVEISAMAERTRQLLLTRTFHCRCPTAGRILPPKFIKLIEPARYLSISCKSLSETLVWMMKSHSSHKLNNG